MLNIHNPATWKHARKAIHAVLPEPVRKFLKRIDPDEINDEIELK